MKKKVLISDNVVIEISNGRTVLQTKKTKQSTGEYTLAFTGDFCKKNKQPKLVILKDGKEIERLFPTHSVIDPGNGALAIFKVDFFDADKQMVFLAQDKNVIESRLVAKKQFIVEEGAVILYQQTGEGFDCITKYLITPIKGVVKRDAFEYLKEFSKLEEEIKK